MGVDKGCIEDTCVGWEEDTLIRIGSLSFRQCLLRTRETQLNVIMFVGIHYLTLLSGILRLFLSNFQCSGKHVDKLVCFLQPDTDPYQVPVNTILLSPV